MPKKASIKDKWQTGRKSISGFCGICQSTTCCESRSAQTYRPTQWTAPAITPPPSLNKTPIPRRNEEDSFRDARTSLLFSRTLKHAGRWKDWHWSQSSVLTKSCLPNQCVAVVVVVVMVVDVVDYVLLQQLYTFHSSDWHMTLVVLTRTRSTSENLAERLFLHLTFLPLSSVPQPADVGSHSHAGSAFLTLLKPVIYMTLTSIRKVRAE